MCYRQLLGRFGIKYVAKYAASHSCDQTMDQTINFTAGETRTVVCKYYTFPKVRDKAVPGNMLHHKRVDKGRVNIQAVQSNVFFLNKQNKTK